MEITAMIFGVLLGSLPVLLVWLVGFILSLVFWKRNPKVCLLTLIAMSGFAITTLVNSYLSTWLPFRLNEQGMPMNKISSLLTIKAIISSLINAGLWGLVIAAIFGGRKQQSLPPLPDKLI